MMMTLVVRYQLKQLIDEQPEKYASLTGIKPEFFQVVPLSTAYVDSGASALARQRSSIAKEIW